MLKKLSLKEPIVQLIHQDKEIVEDLKYRLISESEWKVIKIYVDFMKFNNTCSKNMEGYYHTLGYSISLYYR